MNRSDLKSLSWCYNMSQANKRKLKDLKFQTGHRLWQTVGVGGQDQPSRGLVIMQCDFKLIKQNWKCVMQPCWNTANPYSWRCWKNFMSLFGGLLSFICHIGLWNGQWQPQDASKYCTCILMMALLIFVAGYGVYKEEIPSPKIRLNCEYKIFDKHALKKLKYQNAYNFWKMETKCLLCLISIYKFQNWFEQAGEFLDQPFISS